MKGGRSMNTVTRAKELAEERDLTLHSLAKISHVPYSTIKSAEFRGSQLTVDTIEQLCAGLGITLAQFFSEKSIVK